MKYKGQELDVIEPECQHEFFRCQVPSGDSCQPIYNEVCKLCHWDKTRGCIVPDSVWREWAIHQKGGKRTAEMQIPWTAARDILNQLEAVSLFDVLKQIRDSRGVDLLCAKEIAVALWDGDFEMEDYLDGKYVCLSIEASRLTIA